jgi:adenine-specific DNA-methyltransferase
MDSQSLDLTAEKLAQLRALFPEVFSEDKVDFARLKDMLGEHVAFPNEHYELSWAGKAEARREIQKQTTATLTPSDSPLLVGEGPGVRSGNIFIEGENLEVLRILQKSYFGRIKMIYIDPPYNTGNDSFVYPDDYAERLDEYNRRTGTTDEAGFLNKQDLWRKNSRDNGQFHSVWLSMMYPRLYLARNLLREDGVIFVSIDDNEATTLKLLMDEIFGEENFIAQIIIQSNKRGQTYKEIAKTHEYLLLYSGDDSYEILEIEKGDNQLPFEDKEGRFDLWELRNRNPKFGKHNRPNLYFPIHVSPTKKDTNGYSYISLEKSKEFSVTVYPLNSEGKDSCWRWSKETIIKDGSLNGEIPVIVAKQTRDGKWNIYEKSRKSTTKAKSIWDETAVISEQGTVELGSLGMANYFDHPKPVELIKKCLKITTEKADLILDFFTGSGTTAQAVLELNEEDGGDRKFICVQLPEPLEENSEAYKAGYRTIADICKARIQKVVEKLRSARAKELPLETKQPLGFTSFKLAPSNFKAWRGDVGGEELLKQLEIFRQSEKDGSAEGNMLYELLLKSGLPLTTRVDAVKVGKQNVYLVEDGKLLVFFAAFNKTLKEFIREKSPKQVVCLDSAFQGKDEDLSNFKLELKEAGIELTVI